MLFVLPSHNYLKDIKSAKYTLKRFPDGELYINLHESVKEKTCLILGTTALSDENLISMLLFSSTLKKEGAKKVVALVPYFGYARQDKDKEGESMATSWVGDIMKASGVDEIVTVDIHSDSALKLINVPIKSISPAQLFNNTLGQFDLAKTTIVAPDEGAIDNLKALAGKEDISYFKKSREKEGIEILDFIGSVRQDAIIYDDILSTGNTLVECCKRLKKLGVKNITIMVTHGLFFDSKWEELWSLGVKHIYTTNTTIRALEHESDKITVLPIHDLLIDSA